MRMESIIGVDILEQLNRNQHLIWLIL